MKESCKKQVKKITKMAKLDRETEFDIRETNKAMMELTRNVTEFVSAMKVHNDRETAAHDRLEKAVEDVRAMSRKDMFKAIFFGVIIGTMGSQIPVVLDLLKKWYLGG